MKFTVGVLLMTGAPIEACWLAALGTLAWKTNKIMSVLFNMTHRDHICAAFSYCARTLITVGFEMGRFVNLWLLKKCFSVILPVHPSCCPQSLFSAESTRTTLPLHCCSYQWSKSYLNKYTQKAKYKQLRLMLYMSTKMIICPERMTIWNHLWALPSLISFHMSVQSSRLVFILPWNWAEHWSFAGGSEALGLSGPNCLPSASSGLSTGSAQSVISPP